jgi:hypothetical protein
MQAQNQGKLQVEQTRGQNRIAEIHAKSQDDLANTITEKAMERTEEGVPLNRAMALAERKGDEQILEGGMNP